MERHPEPRTARAATRAPGDPARPFDIATLRQFAGAASAIALLESAADRAVQCGRVLEDTLIVGPPDSGKAVVARALARDAAQRAVELPSPCADASVAAGFRAAVALGAPPTPEVRAAVERRIEAAAVGAWLAGRGSSAGASGRGGRVHGCPGMDVNLAAIARIVAAAG